MNCREAHLLAVRAQDTRLPRLQRLALYWHLTLCRACSHFSKQLHLLREACQRFPDNGGKL